MTDVFISYSSKDRDKIGRTLHASLTQYGREVWMDWSDIPPSANWWNEILHAIENSDNFVFIISPRSLGSPICNLEINHARILNKRIIPVVYEKPVDILAIHLAMIHQELTGFQAVLLDKHDLSSLATENWQMLDSLNWIFYDEQQQINLLVNSILQALDFDSEYVHLHTNIQLAARAWETNGRNAGFLLQSDRLLQAETWLINSSARVPQPTELHKEFIEVSHLEAERLQSEAKAQERRTRKLEKQTQSYEKEKKAAFEEKIQLEGRTRRFRRATILLGLIGTLAIGAFVFALQQVGNTQIQITQAQATLDTINAGAERQQAEITSQRLAQQAQQSNDSNSGIDALSQAFAAIQITLPNPPKLTLEVFAEIAYQPGLVHVLEERHGGFEGLIFSPDNTKLLSQAHPGLQVWDTATGELIESIDTGSIVHTATFSPNGLTVLSGSRNGLIQLWDIATGEVITTFRGHFDIVTRVTFSPDGLFIASGSEDMTIKLWNAISGELIKSFDNLGGTVSDVMFTSDTTQLYSIIQLSDSESQVSIWDIENGNLINSYVNVNNRFSFQPDVTTIVTKTETSRDTTLHLWDVRNGQLIKEFTLSEQETVHDVAITADGTKLITSESRNFISENYLRIRDITTGEILGTLSRWSEPLRDIAISHDESLVAATTTEEVLIWDLKNANTAQILIGKNQSRYNTDVHSVVYSPDGELIASVSGTMGVKLWNTKTGRLVHNLQLGLGSWENVTFAPDGTEVISGAAEQIIIWDTNTGDVLKVIDRQENSVFVQSISVSPDGTRVLVGGGVGQPPSIALFDIEQETVIWTFQEFDFSERKYERILSVDFSPDGSTFVSGSPDGDIRLHNSETGEIISSIRRSGEQIRSVSFSPDGKYLATGSSSQEVRLWTINGRSIASRFTLIGHLGSVESVGFSPDSKLLISGSLDGTLRIWNTSTGELEQQLDNQNDGITSLSFSPDGQHIVTGSKDGVIQIWRYRSLDELIVWTCENRYIRDLTSSEVDSFELNNVDLGCENYLIE